MRKFLWLLVIFFYASPNFAATDANPYPYGARKQCIILLHGLARSHASMQQLERTLRRYHYIVINQDYPSTQKPIDILAQVYLPQMIASCLKYQPKSIHFVTHSMGGILLQKYLQDHQVPKLGKIVMLSPPNHGSEVSDLLHNNWLYKWITGPSGSELTTCKNSVPNQIQLNKDYNIGIIAGTFSFVPFSYYIFKDANDGAVSVSSAKSKIMKDFMSFKVSHPFIMDHKKVQAEIIYFLNKGKFDHRLS